MNVVAPASRARDSHLMLIVVLAALALALLWFVVQKVHYLTDYSPVSYTDYMWPRRAGLIPHVADDVDTLLAWASWAVPLLFAEPLIQLRAMRKRVSVFAA